jgi:hypothetical protein
MLNRPHACAAALSAIAAVGFCPTAMADPCISWDISSDSQTNTCLGWVALYANRSGTRNTAVGASALRRNTGSHNTAIGASALQTGEYLTDGSYNTAMGSGALFSITSGTHNTAVGAQALFYSSAVSHNTAIGRSSLSGFNNGSFGTGVGYGASGSNSNTSIGWAAGPGSASQSTAGGRSALSYLGRGTNNVAYGHQAGLRLFYDASNNIVLGYQAGKDINQYASNAIILGDTSSTYDFNLTRIGTQGTQTRAFIAGISGANILNGQQVVVDSFGQLGVVLSSQRYKEDIQTMGDVSSALMRLRPVTFRYKQAAVDGSKPVQYGLIAEEVEQVMPELVTHNKDGSLQSVAYHVLPSLLLSEYQKQGRELAETKARLVSMRAKLAVLKESVNQLADAKP